jgi:hypothetical protein
MYFLEQLKNQLNLTLRSYDSLAEGAAGWNPVDPIEQHINQNQGLEEEQQPKSAEALAIQELNDELDGIENDSRLVSRYTSILGTFLEKVKAWQIEGLSAQDSDFVRLLELYKWRFDELKDLRDRGHEIEHIISEHMWRLKEGIDEHIEWEDIADNIMREHTDHSELSTQQQELDDLESERSSYGETLREKRNNIPTHVNLPDYFAELISEWEELGVEELDWTIGENIARTIQINAELWVIHKTIDRIIVNNTPDIIYTTRMLWEMTEQYSVHTSDFKTTLLSQILGEEGEWKELQEYITDERIEALQKEHPDGFAFGYDIADIIKLFSEIELPKLDDINDENKQERWEALSAVLEQMSSLNRQMDIVARDVKVIEWEKTFWEQRLELTHEWYKEILEDVEVLEALTDNIWRVPAFEDLWIDHINILTEKWVNLQKLFLVTKSGEQFSWSLSEGEEYIINFSTNTQLAGMLDFSVINSWSEKISINWIEVTLDKNGISGAGYYDINWNQVLLRDGAEISIVKTSERSEPEQLAIEEGVRDRIEGYASESAEHRAFIEAVYSNPATAFEWNTLPKWLAWWFISFMLNTFAGKNYTKNPDGTYSEKSEWWVEWAPATNGELVDAYRQWGMSLGSLSERYESWGQWPHAYVADDNGAGPSYGTYQMNTDRGVYREFAARHNIAPGQPWWEAKIAEVWVETFRQMEHEFIKEKNYDVMIGNITLPGKENFTIAMQNVIWSSAVQHGPHRTQILDAINNSWITPGDYEWEKKLINDIYDTRGSLWEAGINTRYARERPQALAMLDAAVMSPISAEQLAEYWDTWAWLATWIRQINYRKFVDRPSNCGANVWEALKAFWFNGLPNTWRHWYRWASFLENHSDFRELTWVTPQTAPAWSIISYEQNSGWSQARQDYGHVEIAMWNNSWYYFGQRNDRPGWSNPNPQAWDYRIFVPISKT